MFVSPAKTAEEFRTEVVTWLNRQAKHERCTIVTTETDKLLCNARAEALEHEADFFARIIFAE